MIFMITKIKKFVKKYKNYFLLFIFSFLIFSFGFSLGLILKNNLLIRPPIIIEKDLLWEKDDFSQFKNISNFNYLYVASSKGKYYYPIDCPLASNLSEKNKIYFSSKEEAEAKGYIYQTRCDQY